MAYSATALLALASQCAPSVAPETVLAIIQTESSGEQFALNVNGGRQPARQRNAVDAATTARRYVAAGYSVDLGLGQINSRNMRWLGLTWETVFDPCTNVAALARVLTTNYNSVKAGRDPQTALRVALSMYNTGSQTRGFRNGYVAKVVGNAGIADAGVIYAMNLPAVAFSAPESGDLRERLTSENEAPPKPILQARPAPPKWNVFERAAYERDTQILADNERGSI
ncbi:lytic transglycosylase domain-containing protein [Sphingopyxis sp.]|uniref:lytic transglycosylase domain-containing protein n=1 Tax=Sphingopyxis sp. TaxID=1908224 RepID=UPI001DC98EB4|nr:lytic transglycosylase domain-containing protein [Sphingopyxis sp.]MBW8294521.1 lytic transglycosylase domain-containing protein [Sphingopyxis sp.]